MPFSIERPVNELYVWDFTIWADSAKMEDVRGWLKNIAKKWVFQLEKGEETERLHFQCRASLMVKTSWPEAPDYFDGKATFTSGNGRKGFSYVMKEETRVGGPWADTDASEYVPRRFRDANLRGWQKRCYEKLMTQNDRDVMWVCDPAGGVGKSFFGVWLKIHERAITISSSLSTAQQMGGALIKQMRVPDRRYIVVVDLPRALHFNKGKFAEVVTAIEEWKSGIIQDGRNSFKEFFGEPPIIIVFYNRLPAGTSFDELMTPGRAVFWGDFSDEESLEALAL